MDCKAFVVPTEHLAAVALGNVLMLMDSCLLLAGCLAWASVYPLDVIKSRMQAHPSRLGPGAWMRFGRDIYREGGMAAMYRGVKPTLARAFVMDALTFVGYTNVLRFLSSS